MSSLQGICFLVFGAIFLAGCKNSGAERPDRFDSGVLHISCDESFKPVMDAQIQVYEAQYPDTKIIAHYKPEAECINDFLVDSVRLVVATRGFSEKEKTLISDSLKVAPEKFTVAYDAVAVIVNPQATDSFFTLKDVRELIGGKANKNLIPVFDGLKATSTVRFMLDSVLRGAPLGKNVVAAESSQGVIDYVAKTQNAVGFLGISWLGNVDDSLQRSYLKKVRLARLESTDSAGGFVLPVQYLIYTRSYPLIRELVCVLKEKYTGLANGFVAFLRSDRGQLLFRRSYLYPAVRAFYSRETELK
jgi:phosphate transport system substrate-binding protein